MRTARLRTSTHISLRALQAGVIAAAALLGGCGSRQTVARVYDGELRLGRAVGSEAYSAFLAGTLADAAGDSQRALAAYERALRLDDDAPEIWTRLGDLRCRLDPKDQVADRAFGRALDLDPTYAGAHAARSRCDLARGRDDEAAASARAALAADPRAYAAEVMLARASSRRPSPEVRARVVALTLAHGEREAAWDAMLAWGTARADAELTARALAGLARVAPYRRAEIARAALVLAGDGELAAARAAAGAALDAAGAGATGPVPPAAVRLAVDDALTRGDGELARRRGAGGRVGLAELAARAWLLGRGELARELASRVAAADPGAIGARMVLLGAGAEAPAPSVARESVPSACALVLARRLAADAGDAAATAWLAELRVEPLVDADATVGPLAVELAARGVLAESALPPALAVELAARRGDAAALAARLARPDAAELPPRVRLLALAGAEPAGAAARALASRLAGAAERDAMVAAGVGRVALAQPALSAALAGVRRAIEERPADPLLASVAVELFARDGARDRTAAARARLAALASTAAEHERAREP
ncbi:MAG: hypothetical protein R3B36_19595 [Polyangiaceae bacterium]